MQFELQALAQTLKGGMSNRKKSLHGVEREFELLVKKIKNYKRNWLLVKVSAEVAQIQ